MSASPERQTGSPAAPPSDHEDAKPTVDEPQAEGSPAAEDHDEEPAAGENSGEDAEENEGGGDVSDDESILSEVDEAQFEDFDPAAVDVEERAPLAIDEDNLKLIGRHKRKRDDDGDEGRPRRKKEGRREKKSRRIKDLEEGPERTQRRERKRREATPEDEELLDPATRMFSLISLVRCFVLMIMMG